MTELVCALTGHRELLPDFDENVLHDTLEDLILRGYTTFLCGMARGFDLCALRCLIELKQRYHVRIKACIPYAGQEKHFPEADKRAYRDLLGWCDEKVTLSGQFFSGCFLARDRYMVDGCDLLVAYLKRETGGTAYTVKYAQSRGVAVQFIE